MRTADLVSTVIAIWHAVALLHRTDVTTTVVATYGVVGAAFIRKWPQRVLSAFVLIARYFRFYFWREFNGWRWQNDISRSS